MNTCITITCSTCDQDLDCRIGYSNRKIQPLAFACPNCDTLVGITLDISQAPKTKFKYEGCTPSTNQPTGPFNGEHPFVDLHLDFPVRFGSYIPGNTPFMMAMDDLRLAAGDDENSGARSLAMLQNFNFNMSVLNELADQTEFVKKLINLYLGKNKQLFQQKAATFLEKDVNKSLLPQDVNATLYSVIGRAFLPFTFHHHNAEISAGMPEIFRRIQPEELGRLIEDICNSGFLPELHRDCLRIYPRVLDIELHLRPALFSDLTQNTSAAKTATRVSTQNFISIKDLYKDIIEVINRQLVLIAGINNLLYRGNAQSFATISGGTLSSLNSFSGKTLSDKFKYLDNCFYKLDMDVFNLGLRNAIAHNNISYDSTSQIVTYYPNGGRITQVDAEKITLLELLRLLLISFREMHSQNHIMKSILYYKFLIHDKQK